MPPKENVQADPISQIVNSIKSANNVLITVSANPSVDQLAACIGLTVAINKLGKHGTAVFSGKVPSTLEFLKPENTLERNTDSLRDFIISLDKSKADKLRYKVEDNVVKIFITPYRTSISDKDLEFTQGDFNIDAVVALGVHERADLDTAIMSHGRILHSAVITSINTSNRSELGSINWLDNKASSLCEMVADLVVRMDEKIIDSQIATALLTGMVAETNRFGNEKASPHTMSVSGTLMAAGASPQLIASKLDEPQEPAAEIPAVVESAEDAPAQTPDGTIEIDHEPASPELTKEQPEEVPEDEIHIDDQGKLHKVRDFRDHSPSNETPLTAGSTGMVLEPPTLGGQLTANSVSQDKQYSGSTDPLSKTPDSRPMLSRDAPLAGSSSAEPVSKPAVRVDDSQTLSEIEETVRMQQPAEPPAESPQPESSDQAANNEVPELSMDELSKVAQQVAEQADERPHPLEAIGATGDLNLDHAVESPTPPLPIDSPEAASVPSDQSDEQKPSQEPPPPVPPPLPPM